MNTLYLPQWKKDVSASPMKTVMDQLLESGVPVASSCKGDGICGKCKLKFENPSIPLPSPSPLELETLKKAHGGRHERLSCQVLCKGSVTVSADYW